ncbi:hypothetical protein IWC96_00995 [Brevundimonas sp. BAL450]|jgi:hypothetical protein|uniref:Uncharacterized protein n=1 Tax=Brevundimonas abyssalis TAR-001 TaxID=1391729 RepID=A0A8E0KL37_9CAUL|nr:MULTISPECIES: hypothetical protein [Brevundimonas]MBG7613855.1 hypothetical protein [Brevundimonas sp. BAL450]GAD59285.1 hypothetical protein MBEBAB_1535 [Brevundimonas abyssalis TAR-001]
MPGYNGLLMRDSLQDTGVIPSPGYPYYSPDLICHEQVADPQSFFTGNYDTDPNQPVQLGSQTNFFYVRTKNLSDGPVSGWYIHCYRSSASLFMTPSIWKNNPLYTRSGNPFVQTGSIASGAVGVGQDNFLLDAISSPLFCMIGVASPSSTPSIPDGFTSYGDYVLWVRQNQNVCGRNLTYLQSFPDRQFSRLDALSNPSNEAVPVLAKVEARGPLPAGTTFGVQCAPAGLNASGDTSNTTLITGSGMTPAQFDGTVTTWGSLPAGVNTWPPGATLTTTLYYGQDIGHAAHQYGEPWERFSVRPGEIEGMPRDGVLVRLGDTGTVFLA